MKKYEITITKGYTDVIFTFDNYETASVFLQTAMDNCKLDVEFKIRSCEEKTDDDDF